MVAYRPVGVVSVITAYNYPILLALRSVGGALAAGCTVVLAPSPKTPLTALMLARVAEEAGFPPGVVNVVVGDPEVGRRITTHPAVDKIAFTGSRSVGAMILEQAASTIKGVTLELGGKSPTLILPGVDTARIVRRVHTKYLLNAGQDCAAPARVLVSSEDYETVAALSHAAFEKITVGEPWNPKTIVGPLISAEHRQRVEDVVEQAVSQGADDRRRRRPPRARAGLVYQPGTGRRRQSRADRSPIAQEEAFGPVGVLVAYNGIDDGVAKANDVPYGLAADVYAPGSASGIAIARRLRAGTVYVNGGGAFRTDAPFGGFKSSGIRREYGEWGAREFLEAQLIQWPLS